MNVRIILNGDLVMAKAMTAVPRVGDTMRFAGKTDGEPPRYAVVTEVLWGLDGSIEDVSVRAVLEPRMNRVERALETLS